MLVFKIPELLAQKYDGMGYALAASVNGQIVELVYLRNALPDFQVDYLDDGDCRQGEALLKQAVADPRLGPTVRRLQALGDVHAGMCSCWEFVEL